MTAFQKLLIKKRFLTSFEMTNIYDYIGISGRLHRPEIPFSILQACHPERNDSGERDLFGLLSLHYTPFFR